MNPTACNESLEDYQEFLQGLRDALHPQGQLEEELVSMIAIELWTLRRIQRQITALINQQASKLEPPKPVSFFNGPKPTLRNSINWSAFIDPETAIMELEILDQIPEDAVIADDVLVDLRRALTMLLGGGSGFDRIRTVGDLRKVFSYYGELRKMESGQLREATKFMLEMAYDQGRAAADRLNNSHREEAARAERSARAFLPNLDEYEKLLRYKRTSERSFEKLFAQLETAQRARSGDLVAPIRVELIGDAGIGPDAQ